MATHAENILSIFGGSRSRRRVSGSLSKRRMTSKAKADVEESLDAIEEFKAQLADLEDELAEELDELNQEWDEKSAALEEQVVTPYKKDIHIELFGVTWMPFWVLRSSEETIELPGYQL
jgi:DNA-binding ferritin-like protein